MVVCGALTVHCGGGFAISSGFLFFFSSFYVVPNTVKYFQKQFSNANKHRKNKYFPVNHLHLQTFYGREYFTSKQTEP